MTPLKRALFVVIPFFLSKTYPYTSNRNLSVQPKAAKATSMKRNTGYAFKDTSWNLDSTTTWQFVYYSSNLNWDAIQVSLPVKFASIYTDKGGLHKNKADAKSAIYWYFASIASELLMKNMKFALKNIKFAIKNMKFSIKTMKFSIKTM